MGVAAAGGRAEEGGTRHDTRTPPSRPPQDTLASGVVRPCHPAHIPALYAAPAVVSVLRWPRGPLVRRVEGHWAGYTRHTPPPSHLAGGHSTMLFAAATAAPPTAPPPARPLLPVSLRGRTLAGPPQRSVVGGGAARRVCVWRVRGVGARGVAAAWLLKQRPCALLVIDERPRTACSESPAAQGRDGRVYLRPSRTPVLYPPP